MQLKNGICVSCNKYTIIVNAKYKLCVKCNNSRLNPNGKKTTKLKQISKKGLISNEKKKEAYKVVDSREHVCSGCGITRYLSHSHIIPISLRKDLEANSDNIVFDCLSIGERKGCHDIWEHGTIKEKMKLNNFKERLEWIKFQEPKLYFKILERAEKEGVTL